ncbi:hypothetical protein WN51_09326 [Melipona quadrifasciata]|uniref:Uncharacterized protein n=1 Tax=Melipona quadrifasciata TaxID=166423 RepID=A0A0N0BIG2_9HYME|nr:hypothetical protein WN51_09326 [Melipona quadrifasciata]
MQRELQRPIWCKLNTKQAIDLLFLNNFYPVISYRRVQREKKATNYCIRFGHSLWSANQLPAQRGSRLSHLGL